MGEDSDSGFEDAILQMENFRLDDGEGMDQVVVFLFFYNTFIANLQSKQISVLPVQFSEEGTADSAAHVHDNAIANDVAPDPPI